MCWRTVPKNDVSVPKCLKKYVAKKIVNKTYSKIKKTNNKQKTRSVIYKLWRNYWVIYDILIDTNAYEAYRTQFFHFENSLFHSRCKVIGSNSLEIMKN